MRALLLLALLCTGGAATPPIPHPQQQHRTSLHIPQLQFIEGLHSNTFVPELQVPAVEVSASNVQINAVTDLGANNPSKQCSADGISCNYHYARGDAGWISAFEVANTYGVQKVRYCAAAAAAAAAAAQSVLPLPPLLYRRTDYSDSCADLLPTGSVLVWQG